MEKFILSSRFSFCVQGVSDLRCAILKLLFDVEKFPYVNQVLSDKELNLFGKVRSSHDGKNVVMSLKHYQELASSVGLNDEDELEKATKILEMKVSNVKLFWVKERI